MFDAGNVDAALSVETATEAENQDDQNDQDVGTGGDESFDEQQDKRLH
jgi:hypothetical protein